MAKSTPDQPSLPGFLSQRLARDAGSKGRVSAEGQKVDACEKCGNPLRYNKVGRLCFNCAWTGEQTPGTSSSLWGWRRDWVPPPGALDAYKFKSVPYLHQAAALVASHDKRSFAYLMEMGTGKTKVLIDEWAAMVDAGEVRDLLVIAPTGVYRNWLKEIADHLPEDLAERVLIALWISGMGKQRTRDFEWVVKNSDRRRPRIMLANVEALSRVSRLEEACQAFLEGGRGEIGIDESTTIRNPAALRTEAVRNIGALAPYRRIATGLPTPRSPLDLFSQFEFLDWRILGFRSFYGFRARYAIQAKMQVKQVLPNGVEKVRQQRFIVGYRHVDELRDNILPHSFRVLKDECLDLPPKVFEPFDVELTPEQRRVYNEVKKQAMAELASGDFVTVSSVITQMTRLQQIAGGWVVDEEGRTHELPCNRPKQLVELLNFAGGKSIIWAPHLFALHKVYETLTREFGRDSAVRYWGEGVPQSERNEAVARFQDDRSTRFFVGNPSVGGRGITLTAATTVVYYANSWDLEHRLQSEDRPHRAGLDHSVTYIDMIARDTVEEKQIASLRAKMDLAAAITGDGYRAWLI